ncbi:MAG: hypothetical protein NVS9B1_24190 [Candidatus Dormibacteraceae bacterium]
MGADPAPANVTPKRSAIKQRRTRARRAAVADRIRGWLVAAAVLLLVIGVYQLRTAGRTEATGHAAGPHKRSAAAPAVPVPTAAPAPGAAPVRIDSPDVPNGVVPGACVAYPPTGAPLGRTVLVDPGHGGPDPGAIGQLANGTPVREKDLTLAVAGRLRDLLRADGLRVVLTRTGDTSVAALAPSQVRDGAVTDSGVHLDTMARIACANASRADVLLAIHFNAFDDPTAGGAETFYDEAREFGAANARLAALLQSGLIASFHRAGWQVPDRGVLSDTQTGATGATAAADDYGRLMEIGPARPGWLEHPSAMPGALVEPLFVTDYVEAEVGASPEGERAIATGLEQGILGFLLSTEAGA